MTTRERVAAIDIGTNTVLLLIAELGAEGPRVLEEHAMITRLGADVDRTRRLSSEAGARTLACLERYARAIARASAARLDVVGTSALRDAQGGDDFLDAAERLLGTRPRVISGEEEALLTFRGALSGLGVQGRMLVFDIGGGSTEVISGEVTAARFEIHRAQSFDVGSVRLHERHGLSDPPTGEQLSNVERDVYSALATMPKVSAPIQLVGVAGTLTTLAAMNQRLEPYDGAKVHGSVLDKHAIERLIGELRPLSVAQRRSLPGLDEKRADVILTGALIARAVLELAGARDLLVSDRGVRWGLVQQLFERA